MMTKPRRQASRSRGQAWPALLAGVMATLVGIGLARFAYTPLIPVLIEAGWFSASDAVYLGAANLLGYLAGALGAHRLTERFAPRLIVGISLAVIVLSFWFCAWPASFYWFFVWRVLAGVAGATLMVVVPSMALSRAPVGQRALIGTMAFSGVGIGVILAATVIPLLLSLGLGFTWLTLGVLSLACAIGCDSGMRHMPQAQDNPVPGREANSRPQSVKATVLLVIAAYALDAAGFVPHTVFWVDYLARQNQFGQTAASLQWAIFGLGALFGPFLMRGLVGRFGWSKSLLLVFAVKAMAIALPVFSLAWVSQTVSSFVVGALVPGLTALTSGRLAELVGTSRHKQVWGQATAAFAAAQAASGYGMSMAYDALGSYTPLYAVASGLLAVGAILVMTSARAEVGR